MATQGEPFEKYQYAYCILYYEGHDEQERDDCEAFVEMLKKRFKKKIRSNKYSVFSQWSDQLGQSKLKVHMEVGKKSFFTIVLFSPRNDEQKLTQYFGENYFTSYIDNGRYIPVSINDAKVPEFLNALGGCHFTRDFRTDEKSWDVVLKHICKEKAHFLEKAANSGESDSEEDYPDENQDEGERGNVMLPEPVYPIQEVTPHDQGGAIGEVVPRNMGADGGVDVSRLDMNDGRSEQWSNLVPCGEEPAPVGANVNREPRVPTGVVSDRSSTSTCDEDALDGACSQIGIQAEVCVQTGPNETTENQPPAALSPMTSHDDNLPESLPNQEQPGQNMVERLPPAGGFKSSFWGFFSKFSDWNG